MIIKLFYYLLYPLDLGYYIGTFLNEYAEKIDGWKRPGGFLTFVTCLYMLIPVFTFAGLFHLSLGIFFRESMLLLSFYAEFLASDLIVNNIESRREEIYERYSTRINKPWKCWCIGIALYLLMMIILTLSAMFYNHAGPFKNL